MDELFSYRADQLLHNGLGACWLRQPEIGNLVNSALQHFHNDRYGLLAWSVMPNHVHAVVQPDQACLEDILHSWKSYTGKAANKMLLRTGEFWQVEYYDHLVRDEEDLRNQILYTLNNPVKAGLLRWEWVGHNLEGVVLT